MMGYGGQRFFRAYIYICPIWTYIFWWEHSLDIDFEPKLKLGIGLHKNSKKKTRFGSGNAKIFAPAAS